MAQQPKNNAKKPQRPVYDYQSIGNQMGRAKQKQRPVYQYEQQQTPPAHNGGAAAASPAAAPVFDQDTAPVPKRQPAGKSGTMQQMVLPLGVIHTRPQDAGEAAKAVPPQAARADRTQPARPAMAQAPLPQTVRPPAEKARQQHSAAQKSARRAQPPQKQQTQKTPVQREARGEMPPAPAERPQRAGASSPADAPMHNSPQAAQRKARPLSYGEAQRRRRRRRAMAGTAVAAVLVCGILFSFKVLFKIQNLAMTGETPYTAQEILTAFGVKQGDNLFSFQAEETAAQLQQTLPYLESVTVRRRLPDSVELVCTPAAESYTLNSPSGWVVLSGAFKVLRLAGEMPSGVIVVFGTDAESPQPGQTVAFTEPDKLAALQTLAGAFVESGLSAISEIDLTNTLEISFLYENRVRVVLGTVNDVENKMDFARYLLTADAEECLDESARGTLDVSSRNAEGRMQGVWSAGKL